MVNSGDLKKKIEEKHDDDQDEDKGFFEFEDPKGVGGVTEEDVEIVTITGDGEVDESEDDVGVAHVF